MAQRLFGNLVRGVEQDAPVAAIAELRRVQLAEGFDQIGLAMEIDRVAIGRRV